jgi:acyl-CoA synthetase (AMP-forming)/AMP-acid ligase II
MDKDGYFTIVDRKKDMIIVSGFNVYPNEIEEQIAAVPGVTEVGVIGMPDDKTGEAVVAYVVAGLPAPTRKNYRRTRPRRKLSLLTNFLRAQSARSCVANYELVQ